MPEHTLSEPLDATDLMQLGYGDDALLLEDVTLCTLCSHTCCCTAQEQ